MKTLLILCFVVLGFAGFASADTVVVEHHHPYHRHYVHHYHHRHHVTVVHEG